MANVASMVAVKRPSLIPGSMYGFLLFGGRNVRERVVGALLMFTGFVVIAVYGQAAPLLTWAIVHEKLYPAVRNADPGCVWEKRMAILMKFLALIVFLSVLATQAEGQIYQYTDKKGDVVFTDKPPQGSDAKEKQLKDDGIFWSSPQEEPGPSPGGSSPAASSVPASEQKRKRSYSDVTVVMYTTDWCGYCKKAREYVRSLGAGLVEYNIENDQSRKDEMRKKSGGSSMVPLIDIDGTIIRGYSPPAIKAALDRSSAR